MSVKQRSNSWEAYIQVGSKRIRRSFSTKGEATVFEAQARQALELGKPVPTIKGSSVSTSFREMANKTYDMYWDGSKSDDKQLLMIGVLARWFGDKRDITTIDTELLDEYIMHCKTNETISNSTINRRLAAMSKILKHAYELGRIEKLPTFHRQKEGHTRLRWLTADEEKAILDLLSQWSQYDIKDAFIVSIDTGIRYSEMLALQPHHVTKDGLYISTSKNDSPRLVPLTTRARAVLESRAKQGGKLFDFRRQWHKETWDKVRSHLGFTDVVWHTLRHTTCSRLIQGGMPLTHVKEWMGHKAVQTTMRYAHLAPKHLVSGVSVLEQSVVV